MKTIILLLASIIPYHFRHEETYRMMGWDSKQECLVMLIISKKRQIIVGQTELTDEMHRAIFGVTKREDK